jgi:hypothetical protein
MAAHGGAGRTPKPIVDRLHAELKIAAQLPDIHKQMIDLGTIPVDSPPPAELKNFLASEIARWGSIIDKAGVAGSQDATDRDHRFGRHGTADGAAPHRQGLCCLWL